MKGTPLALLLMMVLGIIFFALIVIGGIVEWYVYDRAIYWHDDERDPRNFRPPN